MGIIRNAYILSNFIKTKLLNIIKENDLFYNEKLLNSTNLDEKKYLLRCLRSICTDIEDYQKQREYNDIKNELSETRKEIICTMK